VVESGVRRGWFGEVQLPAAGAGIGREDDGEPCGAVGDLDADGNR
jgi:hypothetical protein